MKIRDLYQKLEDVNVNGVAGDVGDEDIAAGDVVVGALADRLSTAELELSGAWVNVKSYGAVGDGVADDTTPLNNAIAALPAGGGTLYFPPGVYLTTGLDFGTRPNVLVLGAGGSGQDGTVGEGVSRLVVTGSGNTGIKYAVGAGSLQFQGITIRGLHVKAAASAANGTGINLGNAANCVLDCVSISDFNTGTGLVCGAASGTSGSQYHTFRSLVVSLCKIGVDLVDTNGAEFFGGFIQCGYPPAVPAGSIGIRVKAASDSARLFGTRMQFCETCLDEASANTEAHGCRFEGFTTAIKSDGTFFALWGGQINNSILGGTGTGIHLTTNSNSAVLAPAEYTSVATSLQNDSGQVANVFTQNAGGWDMGAMSVASTLNVPHLGPITIPDNGINIALGTTAGTKLGTATSQKLGFWNATPVAQPSGSSDVLASLVSIGLRAASSNPPLNLGSGALTAGAAALKSASSDTASAGRTGDLVLQNTDSTTNAYTLMEHDSPTGVIAAGIQFVNVTPASHHGKILFFSRGPSGFTTPLTIADGDVSISGATLTLADTRNIVFATGTGTKIGTATGQKLGFWNATPVAQQVLATGTGKTVDNVITLLQTLGLCKQS